MRGTIIPSGRESAFDEGEIIVSKTDLKGRITYANEVFIRVSGFVPADLLGAPHNIIRHPDMPRCVFKLMWETIRARQEIFAYVLNLSLNGDHYWVLAHVTPSFDRTGAHIGYHSNRRKPETGALAVVEPLYRTLLGIEKRASDPRQGLADSTRHLTELLTEKGMAYDQFVFSL